MALNIKLNNGFTLIELLIATSLLSLVMFSGYYSYGVYTTKWQKRVNDFWQQSNSALGLEMISRSIDAIKPYIVGWEGDNQKPVIIFEGDRNHIIYVTSSPLFSEKIALVKLEIVFNKSGLLDLIYSESSFEESYILFWPKKNLNWRSQTIILENLTKFEFQFYGWASFNEAMNANQDVLSRDYADPMPKPAIYSEHNSSVRQLLPFDIYINFQLANQILPSQVVISLPTHTFLSLPQYMRQDN